MRKQIINTILSAMLLFCSCKKETTCHQCGIYTYHQTSGQYYPSGKGETFCGTDKELKKYVEYKLTTGAKLTCQ